MFDLLRDNPDRVWSITQSHWRQLAQEAENSRILNRLNGARAGLAERVLSRTGDFLIAAGLRLKARRAVSGEHVYVP